MEEKNFDPFAPATPLDGAQLIDLRFVPYHIVMHERIEEKGEKITNPKPYADFMVGLDDSKIKGKKNAKAFVIFAMPV